RRRELLLLLPVDHLHDREVVVNPAARVGDLEDLAIASGFLVHPFGRRAVNSRAVVEGPLVAGNRPSGAPGARAADRYLLASRDQEVRAGDSNHLRLVLALVRLPKEGVRILDAPPAGRLPGLDVEVQVGPPTAAAFLAENADLLPRLDARAGLDGVG